jgi:hypothetical protein
MASGSLTRGLEADEDPKKGGATPFPQKDVIMMIYDGHPSSGVCHVYDLGLGAPAHCG